MKRIFSFLFTGLIFAVAVVWAEAPNLITYQGRLKENNLPVSDNRSIEIRFCTVASGEPCYPAVIGASAQSVTVANGLFKSTVTVPVGVDLSAGPWYLAVYVGGVELTPREQFTSVPFALYASSAAAAATAAEAALHSGKRYTTAAVAPGTPSSGDLWFDTATNILKFWDGATWKTADASVAAIHAASHTGAGSDPLTLLGAVTMSGPLTLSASSLTVTGAGLSVGDKFLVSTAGVTGIGDISGVELDTNSAVHAVATISPATGEGRVAVFGDARTNGSTAGVLLAAGNFEANANGPDSAEQIIGSRAKIRRETAGGGTVTNAMGVFVDDIQLESGAGTITNTYGVYIGSQTGAVGTQTNLPYALYSMDPAARTYLAGNVGIGTTAPGEKLHVVGTVKATNGIAASTGVFTGDVGVAGDFTANSGAGNIVRLSSTVVYGTLQVTGGVNSDQGLSAYLSSTQTFSGQNAFQNQVTVSSNLLVTAGSVGIGTASPAYRLSVSSGAGETGTVFAVSTGTTNVFYVAGNGAHATKYYGDGSGLTGVTADNATKLIGKTWTWSSQPGQPVGLWGGTDGTNMYVYDPANFSVSYAATAGAVTGSGGTLTVSSLTATGELGVGAAQLQLANNVVLSSAPAAQYGGISISSHVYLSAGAKYYGDGAALTNVSTNTFKIGDSYGGGKIFWVDAAGKQVLIAATIDQSGGIQWSNNTNATGANFDGVYAGKANTVTISTMQHAGSYVAQVCSDYSITVNGEYYDDWYLPSKTELQLLYTQRTAVGMPSANIYWSSNEYVPGTTHAWFVNFGTGFMTTASKTDTNKSVHCVRAGPSSAIGNLPTNAETVTDGAYLSSTQTFTGSNTFKDIAVSSAATITGNSGVYGLTVSSNISLAGALYTANDKVGIGTATPDYRLSVSSGAGEAGIVFAVSTGATNVFYVAGDGAHATKYYGDGSNLTNVAASGVADNAITSAKIADDSIINADINASAAIAKSKLAALNIVNADVDVAAAIAYSKLNLANSVANADLAGSIADGKLSQITTANKVATGAIAAGTLATDVVASSVAAGKIYTAAIADLAVTSAKLAGTIDATKIGGGGVSTAEFDYLGTVTSNVQDQINIKVSSALASANIFVGNATGVAAPVAMSGDVTISNAGVSAIGAAKVTNAMLAGSIDPSKISGTAATLGANTFIGTQTYGSGASITAAANINEIIISTSVAITQGGLTASSGTFTANVDVNGFILAGSGNNQITTAAGFLDTTKLATDLAYTQVDGIVGQAINTIAAGDDSRFPAGADIVNTDIGASAAIAKSKLAALAIVNADLSGTAGITDANLAQIATANKVALTALAAGTLAIDVVASSVAPSGVRPGSIVAGAITNADINAAAAIAKSKLAALNIVNADVDAAAAIAPSKISGTAAILGANTFTGAQTYGSGASIAAVANQAGVSVSTAVFIGSGANISTITAAGFSGGGANLTGLSAANISAGTLASARGGTGQNSSAWSGFAKLIAGTWSAASLAAGDIPSLDVTKITTGKFTDNMMSISTGAFPGGFNAASQLVALDGTSKLPAVNGSALTALNASNLVTGSLNTDRIPGTIVSTHIVDGAIADADINASAAIAPSKITGTAAILGANTFTGAQTLPGDPASVLQAAPKQYVDSWTRPCVNPGDANDILVPVGAWCVDKYEASVWSSPTGGTQYGVNGLADYPATCGNGLTGTGQGCTTGAGDVPIYARSTVGNKPSTSLTWFQANIACGNAGKELLPNAVWQMAAAGTPDPGTGVASPGCKVNSIPDAASALTGERTACVSGYSVENMVGSVSEWVADWGQYGQISQGTYVAWADGTATTTHWPDAGYGADASWNVAGKSYNGSVWVNGLPAAVIRGGDWVDVANAGVFAFIASIAPSGVSAGIGFRCGRRR